MNAAGVKYISPFFCPKRATLADPNSQGVTMTNPQDELFYDDEHHALRRMVEEGKGYKKTAAHLWPDMKIESAYSKLKHACNGTNGESLRFGQVIEICNFNERYDALYHFCDRVTHHRPAPKLLRKEEARLVDVIENAASTVAKALRELERVRSIEIARESDGHIHPIGLKTS
jgi:hypothetical protein